MGLFDSIKENAVAAFSYAGKSAVQALINSSYVKSVVGRSLIGYADLESLECGDDLSLTVSVRILGIPSSIQVSVCEYSIAPDGSWVSVGKASSPAPGIQKMLDTAIVGRKFPIPEAHRSTVAKIGSLLFSSEQRHTADGALHREQGAAESKPEESPTPKRKSDRYSNPRISRREP